MTDKEKEKKRQREAEEALKKLGKGMARQAGMTLSGRKKQLDDAIAAAGG